jgi:hypothetical protein
MLIRPVDYFLVVWFPLALASTLYVGWDQYRNNPEPPPRDEVGVYPGHPLHGAARAAAVRARRQGAVAR